MNFLNYIFASHWAIDGKIGRAALSLITNRAEGVRVSPEGILAVLSGRSAARAHLRRDGGGGAKAMEDDGEDSRLTPMEASRPWDGLLMTRSPEDRQRGFYIQDGAAVVPVEGVMCRYASLINDASQPRGTSSDAIVRSIASADADPNSTGIVLAIDSPGGTVAGIAEVATAIRRARKPVVAHVGYLCCSAAYWMASQAQMITGEETALIGNIGVYQVMEDTSIQNAAMGVKVHVIKAGAWKAMGVPGAPITEGQLKIVQEEIDAVYKTFVRAVATGRKMQESRAAEVADGRAWSTQDAVTLGLADKVGTLEDAITLVKGLKR